MKGKHQIVNDYSCPSEGTREMKEILNVADFCFVFFWGGGTVSTTSQADLKLIPPVSTLRILEFPFCNTTSGLHLLEYFFVLYKKIFLEKIEATGCHSGYIDLESSWYSHDFRTITGVFVNIILYPSFKN